MKWKMIITIFVTLIGTYFVLGDTEILTNHENYVFQKKLKNLIKSGVTELKFKDLTDFEWDKMCFYIPYDYKTGEEVESNWWHLTFRLNNEIKSRFYTISKNIAYLAPEKEGSEYFCYKSDKVFLLKRSKVMFIILD